MKPNAIIVFLVLAMLTSQAFSWWISSRKRQKPTTVPTTSGSSPAGGPSSNPNAVVCTFYRSSNKVTCEKDESSVTCTTQPPEGENRDDQPGGPTPLGEYLIGKRRTHPKHRIDWYNLYPKKEDDSGYYNYIETTQKGRSTMGLHPGRNSEGCVTVKALTYDDDPCWQQIREVIDSGKMWYCGSYYRGFLYVK